MLLLRNNDIKNKGIARIITVAVLSLIVLIGIEGTIYNNPHVSAVDNNNISYTMEFIENVVENMPDNILDGLTPGASSLIPSNNPIRSGFKFGGWCDQATTKSGDYDICATGHSHQPGDTISLNQTGANNIKLYAIWEEERPEPQPSTAGCINYFANASDAVGTMGCQSATDNNSITLLASNFSRTGYGFAGWSDAYDYATNPNAHFYGPQEDITVPTGTTANGLSLYAVWVESEGSIQDQSKVASVCNRLTTAPTDGTATLASVSALTDERDHQTYAIAKLADGKCWMIENLRLESTAEHNTDGTLAQGYHSSFAGLATAESANSWNYTTANSLYSTDGSTTKTIDSTGGNLDYRFPRYNNTNTSVRAEYTTNQNVTYQNANIHSYGNYYTWHAAIADTTHNGSNNTSSDTTSICPKGWRLPHGGQTTVNTTAEFYLLGKAIMNNIEPDQDASNGYGYYSNSVTNTAGKTATVAFRSYPNNFLYSGDFGASSASYRGSIGYYWSSTAYDNLSSYLLYFHSSRVRPGTNDYYKYYGYSIRCVSGS